MKVYGVTVVVAVAVVVVVERSNIRTNYGEEKSRKRWMRGWTE
jgi:hypothetical protein